MSWITQAFKGDSAEVTSALPLNPDEEATVRQEVLSRIGAKQVAFRVDPAILGGLVIKVGDKVMDNSVAGQSRRPAPELEINNQRPRKS